MHAWALASAANLLPPINQQTDDEVESEEEDFAHASGDMRLKRQKNTAHASEDMRLEEKPRKLEEQQALSPLHFLKQTVSYFNLAIDDTPLGRCSSKESNRSFRTDWYCKDSGTQYSPLKLLSYRELTIRSGIVLPETKNQKRNAKRKKARKLRKESSNVIEETRKESSNVIEETLPPSNLYHKNNLNVTMDTVIKEVNKREPNPRAAKRKRNQANKKKIIEVLQFESRKLAGRVGWLRKSISKFSAWLFSHKRVNENKRHKRI